MELHTCMGIPGHVRLSNGDAEVLVSTAYGPRVIPIDQTCGLRIEKPLLPPSTPALER